jgi:hypothetical protein
MDRLLGRRNYRDGRVQVFGCSPGCLIVSLLVSLFVSILLTIFLNVAIRGF